MTRTMETGKPLSSKTTPPVPEGWSWLDALQGQFDEDALEAATEQPEIQEREGLSELFPE